MKALTGMLVLVSVAASIFAVNVGAHHSKEHNVKVIRKLFGSRSPSALGVASCETGGRLGWTFATGRAGEKGIFQIHPIWRYRFEQVTGYGWHQAYLPKANAKFAYWLSSQRDRQGRVIPGSGGTDWHHWTCRWAA